MSNRAPFSPDLQPLRDDLAALLPQLEAKPDWYASIYFERKTSRTCMANLRQTNVSENVSLGAVLRIYDGYTLFEQATDDLASEALRRTAQEFVARVSATQPQSGAERRPYQPVSWNERLASKLETEITSQVPSGAKPSTPVHFGVRYERDPRALSVEGRLKELKTLVGRCVELAPQAGLAIEDLTYVMARQSVSEEESIFIDRETNMSQTLFRLALTVMTMSGADRTVSRVGGLGGWETVEFPDSEIRVLLDDLKSLKGALRLSPGKYRVLFNPVLSGILAHEAFGHSQEGDTCARGRSKAWDLHLSKESVGNQHATILNNPAIFQNGPHDHAAWGSYFFDEEGWLAQEQVLLDRGELGAPMTNLTSAIRLGVPRTANGKRESWANGVYTRQTNTYFSAGDQTYDQLLGQIDDGFVATEPAGGMEDPKGMGIQVGIQFLKEVKKGKLTGRVFKGPAGGDIQMTGYTPDVLNSIVAKSKIEAETSSPDRARFPVNDVGGCGKYHKEVVFAGCGGPYLLLDQVILG
jgi:TldD protein